jgi:16S rRNA (uracil1498-N3)-methyltransferase
MLLQNNNIRKLHRLHIIDVISEEIVIDNQEDVHYVAHVLRLDIDSQIRVFNMQGEFLAQITAISKKNIILKIINLLRDAKNISKKFLFFSPIKSWKNELVIEKAVELGITDLIPVITARTLMRKINYERIAKIIKEAVEQSERLDIPVFHNPINISEFEHFYNEKQLIGKILYCDEQIEHLGGINIAKILESDMIGAIIGAEGGFTKNERELILSNKFILPISLGDKILKAETAAIVACTLLNIEKID